MAARVGDELLRRRLVVTKAEVFDETNAVRYPLIMTVERTGRRYRWRLAVGPFDATGHTLTCRAALRQVRRTAEVFALCASVKAQWADGYGTECHDPECQAAPTAWRHFHR